MRTQNILGNKLSVVLLFVCIILGMSSFTIKKIYQQETEKVMDFVCGMKVDKSEAYISKYKGKDYYFDKVECKKAFDMNPDKVINAKCTKMEADEKGEKPIDLVCGMKVDKSEGYISKFNGKEYYFDKVECKKTFEMNPQKYIDNKCGPKK